MRKRARRSQFTCGYCLPGWLEDAGLKSSTTCAACAGVVCAEPGRPASRGSNASAIDTFFTVVLLATNTGPEEDTITSNYNVYALSLQSISRDRADS